MSGHTPGPLLIKGDEIGYISNHDDQSFGMFCPVAIICNDDYTSLIAAAPDLLAALQEAVAVIERIKPPENGNGTVVRARAAIAKATGEPA